MNHEAFKEVPNFPLYHYTDQKGLIGILSSKQIWLSHSQYLNDSREFRHAIELVHDEIKILETSLPDPGDRDTAKSLHEQLDGIEKTNVMVCSFSEDRDSLPQWRAYGGRTGFAIGFSSGSIVSDPKNTGILLGKCIYEETDQRELLKSEIKIVFDQKRKWDRNGRTEDEEGLPNQLIPKLLRLAPLIKHESFNSEKEWRLIGIESCSSQNFGFREGVSTIIPYYRHSLLNEKKEMSLHEVVVGPTPQPQLSISAVTSLLIREQSGKRNEERIVWSGYDRYNFLDTVTVNQSSSPFRNW
jgi:hypothetical protein